MTDIAPKILFVTNTFEEFNVIKNYLIDLRVIPVSESEFSVGYLGNQLVSIFNAANMKRHLIQYIVSSSLSYPIMKQIRVLIDFGLSWGCSYEQNIGDILVGDVCISRKLNERNTESKLNVRDIIMNKSSEFQYENNLIKEECGVCLETKQLNMVGSCFHKLCHTCISKLRKDENGIRKCPFCRKSITQKIHVGGILSEPGICDTMKCLLVKNIMPENEDLICGCDNNSFNIVNISEQNSKLWLSIKLLTQMIGKKFVEHENEYEKILEFCISMINDSSFQKLIT